MPLGKLTRAAQKLMRANVTHADEWSVTLTWKNGDQDWFIFQKVDAPTVPDALRLIEGELHDPNDHPFRVVITDVKEY